MQFNFIPFGYSILLEVLSNEGSRMAREEDTYEFMTEDEYLALEANSTRKHEFVDGHVFAMTGGTRAHNILTGNLFAVLHSKLKGGPYQAYVSDVKLRIESQRSYYYPDLMVSCEDFDSDGLFIEEPSIIVEVLSQSTAQIDRREKLISYQKIPSLKEYVIVYQSQKRIDVYRRTKGPNWESKVLFHADELVLEAMPNGTQRIPLSEIYDRCDPPGRVKEPAAYYEADHVAIASAEY